jgi:hypothetical protein
LYIVVCTWRAGHETPVVLNSSSTLSLRLVTEGKGTAITGVDVDVHVVVGPPVT